MMQGRFIKTYTVIAALFSVVPSMAISDSKGQPQQVKKLVESKPIVAEVKPAPLKEELCSFCAKPRGKAGSTTIDIGGGYPFFGSVRAVTSLYANEPSLQGFALSGGLGVRAGLREALVDIVLLSHFYTNRHFSIAAQLVGTLGASLQQAPLLIEQTVLVGGVTAGCIATAKIEPYAYFSLHAAFEYKGMRDLVPFYSQQEGPMFETSSFSTATRSPSTVGLVLEPSVEFAVHKYLNLFVRGGYTFRFETQPYAYALPEQMLSSWHVAAGISVKLRR